MFKTSAFSGKAVAARGARRVASRARVVSVRAHCGDAPLVGGQAPDFSAGTF